MPSLSVFVVDDHHAIREGLGDLVTGTDGLDVWGTAESGDDALAQLEATGAAGATRDGGPDVVVTDVRMPGMDGIALVGAIRARWPALPCVVFSAQLSQAYAVQALAAGAAGYVEKGNLAGLIEAVFRAGSGAG
ncbi:MAG TPA: response regulator transcription factor [Rubricoccaceae bacterium]|jgi:DNA-binding NarL/FixJ family response regulator